MHEETIHLKQYINKDDFSRINALKAICTEKEDIFLKLELDFKLNISQKCNKETSEYVNEFLYYSGETLVGYLGIFNMGSDTGEITGMVHPLFRRQGIFKRLCSLALEECRRRGFKKILLVCDNRSTSGLAFMKSSGATYSFSEYEMKLEENYTSWEPGDITLRKANNSDAEEIKRQNNVFFGVADIRTIMPEDEEKQNRITYMIEFDSKVIGKIRIDFTPHEGYISGFGILQEYRGKGYGKQALKSALYLLNKSSIHNAALEVAAQNKNALNLYKSCGFTEDSVIDYYEAR